MPRVPALLLVPLALAGCRGDDLVLDGDEVVCDADEDGVQGPWCGGLDCNDADALVGEAGVEGCAEGEKEPAEPYVETVLCEDTWEVEDWHFGYQVTDPSMPPVAVAIYTTNPDWLACTEGNVEPYRVATDYQLNEQGFIVLEGGVDGAGCAAKNACSDEEPVIPTEISVTLVVYPSM